MKLITAIVQDEDAHKLISELTEKGFSTTKLATTGGFLRSGNTTLLIGVEAAKLDQVMGIIEKNCKKRTQMSTASLPSPGTAGVYVPYPIEVTIGGATVFVTNVEQYKKI